MVFTPSYIDTSTVLHLLPNLPLSSGAAAWSSTNAIIHKAMQQSESLINGYCARRYTTPFTTVPPMIRTICEDITCYQAMRQLYSRDSQNVNDWVGDFKTAMDMLIEIRDKKIDLANTAGSLLDEKSTNTRIDSTTEYTPIFELDTFTSWAVDEDRLDDVEDVRD